jgi:VanZ family protein
MTSDTHPLLRYGPAVVMTLLIPALSLLPAHFFKHVAEPLPPIPGIDKIIHALMYAALTAAYLQALIPARRRSLLAVLRIVLLAALYGVAMEVCQKLFTTTRSMDPLDALANAAGALTCALLAYGWARCRSCALRPGPRGGAHVG